MAERLGAIQKYVTPFLTKFSSLPLCHKLSHMADPPIKNMSQATTPRPTVCILLTFAP